MPPGLWPAGGATRTAAADAGPTLGPSKPAAGRLDPAPVHPRKALCGRGSRGSGRQPARPTGGPRTRQCRPEKLPAQARRAGPGTLALAGSKVWAPRVVGRKAPAAVPGSMGIHVGQRQHTSSTHPANQSAQSHDRFNTRRNGSRRNPFDESGRLGHPDRAPPGRRHSRIRGGTSQHSGRRSTARRDIARAAGRRTNIGCLRRSWRQDDPLARAGRCRCHCPRYRRAPSWPGCQADRRRRQPAGGLVGRQALPVGASGRPLLRFRRHPEAPGYPLEPSPIGLVALFATASGAFVESVASP